MSRTLLLAFALLLSAAWLQAQNQTSQTTSTQTGTSSNSQTTVQGCLQGSSGNYTLTSDSGTTYQLTGDTSKLSDHVGHEVEITGSTSSSPATTPSSGTSPSTGASASNSAQQTLTVDSMKHVSSTCTSGSK